MYGSLCCTWVLPLCCVSSMHILVGFGSIGNVFANLYHTFSWSGWRRKMCRRPNNVNFCSTLAHEARRPHSGQTWETSGCCRQAQRANAQGEPPYARRRHMLNLSFCAPILRQPNSQKRHRDGVTQRVKGRLRLLVTPRGLNCSEMPEPTETRTACQLLQIHPVPEFCGKGWLSNRRLPCLRRACR